MKKNHNINQKRGFIITDFSWLSLNADSALIVLCFSARKKYKRIVQAFERK